MEGTWVQRKLDVAAALNAECADDLERAVAEHVVFLVGERLRRTHDNRIPGVDADGIHIFHVANGDGGVIGVAHHFIFDLFIAFDALFDQDLADRGERQGIFHDGKEILLAVRKAAAGAAQGKSGTQNDRVADVARRFETFLHGTGNL